MDNRGPAWSISNKRDTHQTVRTIRIGSELTRMSGE
jgi:hypothetical protein